MAQSVGLVLPQILKSHGKCKKIDPSTEGAARKITSREYPGRLSL